MRLILLIFRLLSRLLQLLFAPFLGVFDRMLHDARPDEFRDHARRRSIPYKLYEPQDTAGPAPVVLFSHGMGGSREAAPYLGRALAAAGYWGVFLQHPGSDRAVMKGAGSRDEAMRRLRRSMMDPGNMRDRYLDLPVVLDQLEELARTPGTRFHGRLDMTRVGMAGHSYGARTVLAAAGQRLPGPGLSFHEPRLKAGLLLSPSGSRRPGAGEAQLPQADFATVSIPLLHVTGTRDGTGPGQSQGEADYRARTLPYRAIRAGEQYLLVFDGATHSDFSGTGRNEAPPDSRYTHLVAMAAVLFFDAHLKGLAAARQALREEFPKQLAPGDHYEFR